MRQRCSFRFPEYNISTVDLNPNGSSGALNVSPRSIACPAGRCGCQCGSVLKMLSHLRTLQIRNIAEMWQVDILDQQTESGPESAVDSGPLSMRKQSQEFLSPNECCDSSGNPASGSSCRFSTRQRSRHRQGFSQLNPHVVIYRCRTRDDIEGSFTIASGLWPTIRSQTSSPFWIPSTLKCVPRSSSLSSLSI